MCEPQEKHYGLHLSSPLKNLSNFFSFFEIYSCFLKSFLLLYQLCLSKGMEVRNSKEVQRMAKCEFCDKGVTFGIRVSHSHRRSNRPWKPNVKRVKAIVNGSPRHVYVCTRCMRSGKVTRAV